MKNKEDIQRDTEVNVGETEEKSTENCIWVNGYGLYDPMKKQVLLDELEKVTQ